MMLSGRFGLFGFRLFLPSSPGLSFLRGLHPQRPRTLSVLSAARCPGDAGWELEYWSTGNR